MPVASFNMDGGCIADVRPDQVPPNAWTEVLNYDFGNQGSLGTQEAANLVPGYAATWVTPAAAEPRFALNVDIYGAATRTPTNYRWYGGVVYGGTAARVGQQTGGVDSNVTPASFGGGAPGRWTGGVLNNFVPFLNNQTDRPVYWDYTGPTWSPFPNLPIGVTDTFTALRSYREFMVGMGLLVPAGAYYSDKVFWSNAAAYNTPPSTWVAAATNQAGDATIPGGGECVDGAVLRDSFVIYKQRSSYLMTYVGGNYVMQLRPLFQGWGCYSQNCVAEFAGNHYVFTGSDLIVHDGQRWESMLQGKQRKNISLGTNGKNSFVWVDQKYRQVWACLTRSGQTWPTTAMVVNIDSGKVGYRTLPTLSYMVREGQDDTAALGIYPGTGSASSGRFYGMQDTAAAATTATIERHLLDFGEPSRVKQVKWVRPRIYCPGTAGLAVTVEVAGQMAVDDTVTYGTAATFTLNSSDKADVFAQGRYLSFRFGSTASTTRYAITGFDVGYELQGAY